MDKREEDDASEKTTSVHSESVEDNLSCNNLGKSDGMQRPNQRLLRLAKLTQGSKSPSLNEELKSPNISPNKASQNIAVGPIMKCETSPDIPPPSYESVVKFNPELNSTCIIPSSSQLPRYEDVGGLSDAPPPYHSLFTETMLRVIHPFNSEDALSYNVQHAKLSSIVVNILLFIFMTSFVFLLPVSMIAMGIIYIHKCPVQPRLPIYLIVLGFFQMLECCGRLAFKLFQSQNSRQSETWRDRYRRKDPLIYFVIVWFIIGSMWVYQTDPFCKDCGDKGKILSNLTHFESQNSRGLVNNTVSPLKMGISIQPNTCDKTIYAFAFWIVTSYYSVIAFFFLLVLFDVVTRVVTRFCCPGRQLSRERTSRDA